MLVFSLGLLLMFASFGAVSYAGDGNVATKMLDRIEDLAKESGLQGLRQQALQNYGILINPYFKAAFDFTSNVFKAPNERREDVLWTFTPGVNATYTQEYGQVGLSYEANFRYFTKHGDQNEQDQSFSAFADIHPMENLTLRASEEMVQMGATAGAPGVEPLNFLDNTVNAGMLYQWGELTGEFNYQNFVREYAGDLFDRFSYSENQYTLRSHYQINEDMKATFGYILGFVNYDEDVNGGNVYHSRDATYNEFPVGVEGVLPWGDIFYAGTVSIYLRHQEAKGLNDFWAFMGQALLRKQIGCTSLEAGFLRRPVEATFDVVPIYDEKMFYINAVQQLRKNLRARMDISFSNRDYEDIGTVGNVVAKRDDNVFSYGLGIDYAARKWLIMNLDYRVERRNSNISDFDYTENRLTLGMTIPV